MFGGLLFVYSNLFLIENFKWFARIYYDFLIVASVDDATALAKAFKKSETIYR